MLNNNINFDKGHYSSIINNYLINGEISRALMKVRHLLQEHPSYKNDIYFILLKQNIYLKLLTKYSIESNDKLRKKKF